MTDYVDVDDDDAVAMMMNISARGSVLETK
jgi:hypothetical protein